MLKIFKYFLWGFEHRTNIWMIFYIIVLKQLVNRNSISTSWELSKSMINDSFSFRRNVISDILNEIKIHDVVALTKYLLNDSNFLSSEKDAKIIQKQVECMRRHGSAIGGIEFLNIAIASVQILNISAWQLELEFVINLWKLIEPVHFMLGFLCYVLKLYK